MARKATGTVRNRIIRRVAALREMAELGCTVGRAAELLGVSYAAVYVLHKRLSIGLKPDRIGRPQSVSKLILRDYGKEGMTPCVMAERYGVSRVNVRVTIYRLRKEGKLPPVQQRC